ncbi:hypothetical protein [Lactiplantibacillus plantarum]|uniref:hypothetical protein n=1 Tax=Lactiplantibacillus plantarum TaxID=1590 RepID=UPI0020BFE91D|nr:hypothetical protein [Lactiplantibacillus plantarum]
MSKSEIIQKLLDELNNQNQIYIAIIGIILAVLGLAFTIFSFMQRRFSDKQIKKMEDDFKKDFKIEEINKTLEVATEKSKKLDEALSEAKKTEIELTKQFNLLQNQDLEGKLQLLESRSGNINAVVAENQIKVVSRTMTPMVEHKVIGYNTLMNILVSFSNTFYINVKEKFHGNKDYQDITNRLMLLLNKYIEESIEDGEKKELVENSSRINKQLKLTNNYYNQYKKMVKGSSDSQEEQV